MKTSSIIAVLCLAIGFASGWLLKPDTDTTSADNKAKDTDNSSRSTTRSNTPDNNPRNTPRSSIKISSAKSMKDLDPETRKSIEDSKKKHADMMTKRLHDKFDLQISAMIKELGLNAAQEKSLRAFYADGLKKINWSNMSEMMAEPGATKEIAAVLRGDGLNEYMKTILSEDQMKDLLTMQERKKNNKVEAHAMKDLAKLQQTLDLSEDQKQKVYNLMIEDAEKSIAEQSDTDLVTRTMMSSMGIEMDMGDMDMGAIMALKDSDVDPSMDSAALIKKLKEDRQKRIDAKVTRLAPVLNETQQEQYRKSLESKGGMFNMMIQGMEVEEKAAPIPPGS